MYHIALITHNIVRNDMEIEVAIFVEKIEVVTKLVVEIYWQYGYNNRTTKDCFLEYTKGNCCMGR